ncbi:heat shock 70 kDa protein 12B-like isoform X3 [Dreissena polymorpha]|uniref:heat shock 70 kDa protein 12B-like isoform X2 n=1 Tax=Dreissena polymorpha TaxID=45954 RepID=UPI002264EC2D|nr:heat shock 70 kDa protein 12B-like isoform X2 [Dreissena polymorpha]XP_052218753.1 heat shock 70 kDa protein 12B-like isoform X3 [Dreissena polymorpha]
MQMFKKLFKKPSKAEISETVTSASTIPSPNKSTHTNQAEPGQTAPPLQRRVSKHENYELTKAASTPLLPRTPGKQSLIVAAFDFGTTYSGYAFSFKDSPNDVITNKSWTAGSAKLISLKTPTSVLLNKDGEFDSFGFDAEDKYSSLAEDEKHHGWRLFRRFKMVLHSQQIWRSATVEDLEGKTFPAKPLFTMSLKYLQQHLLDALSMSKIGTRETDIRYIITVPAIWGIAAKQFMREAAIEAGIDGARLKLALEPEAAAVCCEALGHTLAGEKFMVVDIGGGTADISVNEKQSDGSLKNIHAPSGGPWGGIYVDANFIAFMTEVFGTMAITALQSKDMYDYFDMIRDFEVKKRKFEFDSQTDITFRIPVVLKEISEEQFHQSLSDRLRSLKYGKRVFTRGRDKLGVDSSIMQSWFTDPVSKTVDHISSVLKEKRMKDVGLIVLVGGFAESPYVQQRIKEELPGMKLTVPGEAGLAVLKGAVMFGHKHDIISSRVMDYTYGIHVWAYYDEKIHPAERKVYQDGAWIVDNLFDIFVRANEDVPVDSKVSHRTIPSSQSSRISIYRTKNREPYFTTDPGCEKLGHIDKNSNRDIPLKEQITKTTFMFGDTELHIWCENVKTGEVETLTLDLSK